MDASLHVVHHTGSRRDGWSGLRKHWMPGISTAPPSRKLPGHVRLTCWRVWPGVLQVMIWDDHQSRCIGELSFRSEVRAVCLRRDRIVVVLEHKVYVYNFADLKLLQQIDTIANPAGLCCLSPDAKSAVLACPGQRSGQVRVELYESKRARFVAAHNAALACMALTLDGQRLATASSKGTLIRIFNTADCTKLQEVLSVHACADAAGIR